MSEKKETCRKSKRQWFYVAIVGMTTEEKTRAAATRFLNENKLLPNEVKIIRNEAGIIIFYHRSQQIEFSLTTKKAT